MKKENLTNIDSFKNLVLDDHELLFLTGGQSRLSGNTGCHCKCNLKYMGCQCNFPVGGDTGCHCQCFFGTTQPPLGPTPGLPIDGPV